MTKEFKLPELGENIQSADIIQVLIKAGDMVNKDQTVLEIETDKATIEVPSDISGVVKEVKIKQGDKAAVGQTIFTVEDSAENEGETEKPTVTPKQTQQEEPAAKEEEKPAEVPDKAAENKTEAKAEKTDSAQTSQQAPTNGQDSQKAEFKLPELGENIASADILQVKVSAGQRVEKDQIVLEIETDKATIEVPSDVSGVVKDIFVKSGEKAKVGQVIFTVESTGHTTGPDLEKRTSDRLQSAEADENKVAPSQVTESKAPEAKPAEERKPEDKKAPAAAAAPSAPAKAKSYIPDQTVKDPSQLAPAAPTVRRFAREIGVDINQVPGTGPGGRISIPDVKAFAREQSRIKKEEPSLQRIQGVAAEPLPDFTKWGAVETKEMSNIRRKTAEHLSFAWSTVPHVTQFDKADITELERIRKSFGKKAEAQGGKLTITAILLKIVASALKAFPQFNTSVDMANSSVIYKKYYNIGVAVDTDRGLLVPVIKDVDKKNIIELAVELNQLAEKARSKKLSLEEMQGGCITITNLGGIGGTYFTPIVNSPEVAILGVSRGSYEQVYIDGKFEPRLMLPLSLSYDHRIIDGADGARFLRWVTDAIQQPFLMALEG